MSQLSAPTQSTSLVLQALQNASIPDIEILGYIKSVNINAKTCVIYNTTDDRNYSCSTSDWFLPLNENDAICGALQSINGKYVFSQKPLVKLCVDRNTLITAILKALKFQISPHMIQKLYDKIMTVADDANVNEYLDTLAIDLHDKQLEDFGVLPEYLTPAHILKLLRWWYRTRILRKLYLLGLNNKEINDSMTIMQMNPNQIYESCLQDPFKIIPIFLDKCKSIYSLLSRRYTEEQLIMATIARKIYYNNKEKAWTGTPSKYLVDQFREINRNLMQKLEENYGIKGEMHTVYLSFHYKVETTIAEIFSKMIKENYN